jgi:hypothetical protein
MKRAILTLAVVLALAMLAQNASAEAFINGFGGITVPNDADAEVASRNLTPAYRFDTEIESNLNFSGGLAAGYWFNKYGMPYVGVMLDHNASFPTLDRLNALTMFPQDNYTLNGNPKIFQTTVNVMLRYPNKFMTPFIGVGGGLYTMDLIDTEVLVPGGRFYIEDETSHTAGWQAFVGAEMPWPWVLLHKNLAGYMEYRYTTADFDFDTKLVVPAALGPIGPLPVGRSSVSLDMDHSANVLYGGFTWHFN